MIIVRPLDSLEMNALAWGNPEKTIANGAFMMFEKSHPFLED